jgi:hypothetical protein
MAGDGESKRLEGEAPVRRETDLFASVKISTHLVQNLKRKLRDITFGDVAFRDSTAVQETRNCRSDFVESSRNRTAGGEGDQHEESHCAPG